MILRTEKKFDGNRPYVERFIANAAPTATDDSTVGAVVGSEWVATDGTNYVCTDATKGAAVWEQVGGAAAGSYLSRTILTTGTSITLGANTTKIKVRMVGPGGGGAGAPGTGAGQASVGGGGGSGSYAEFEAATTPGQNLPYYVGTGGTGGAIGNAGNAGDYATFSHNAATVTASGGGGGQSSPGPGTTPDLQDGGTAGAVPTNGDLNIPGTRGGKGIRQSGTVAAGGDGASSQLGSGGEGGVANGNTDGLDGLGYGAGGAGAASVNSAGFLGGDGTQGVIIVEEYS
jgi:hypothetical protein